MAFVCILAFMGQASFAQCPPNIDFEEGTFNNWTCWSGSFNGTINVAATPPQVGRHEIYAAPTNLRDNYGLFPILCPNGSGHSIRIGNTTTGQTADRVSYTFTIPAGENTYNLIYHYALVLNDANNSGHTPALQPRFIISVLNMTDGGIPLPCALPPIVVNGGLPGFFDSPNPAPNGSIVRCKSWAAASINLDNLAGKTIELSFTVTGCGLSNGSHFGYAYIDLNSECSSSFTGATFCPDDTVVNITAPYGYQFYKWFDINNTILGTNQILTLNPPPLSGDSVFVELTPYNGYGCLDTLTAHLWDTLTVIAYAGRDTLVCSGSPVQLGGPPRAGQTYSWSPTTYLSDPTISNPIATVAAPMTYILSVTNSGGGCLTKDTVQVNYAVLSDSLELIGPASQCTANGQTVTLKVFPADSIQWYRNTVAIPGATGTTYVVTQTGSYQATLFSFAGCNKSTRVQQIDIFESPVSGFTINDASQCHSGNSFVFTNTSTISAGALIYAWDLGDGTLASTADVTHTYLLPGTYTVKMVVTAPGGCSDSTISSVTVFAGPTAGFNVNGSVQCQKGNFFNFTNTSTITSGTMLYQWDMGDGNTFTTRDVSHSYLLPGTYTVQLIVTSATGFCTDTSRFDVTVNPSPRAGFTVNNGTQCQPGNSFVFTNTTTVDAGTLGFLWDLGDGTTATSTDVTHTYTQPGTYRVRMWVGETGGGCADSTEMTVTVNAVAAGDFIVSPVCTNLRVPIINRTRDVVGTTNNYLWDFGNGITSTNRIPVYRYTTPGTYTITLSVNTAQCPASVSVISRTVVIDAPAPGISLPVFNTFSWFRDTLRARNIGSSVLWLPASNLSDQHSYTPVFYGPADQVYTIQMRTPTGCLTTDTQYVKVGKNIRIYVPNSFTPNSDGRNDFLRPYLISIVKVNYFRIFDRWGKQLFEMRGDRPGWDGRFKGQDVEPQTVVWMIEAVDVDGGIHRQQGTTIIMR